MCTVVIEVPSDANAGVRLLAIRDENPAREWDAPGEWWPDEHPGVIGVRDRQANGAWLATDPAHGRLSVMLNRFDPNPPPPPVGGFASRGALVLDTVTGASLDAAPRTPNFNLVTVSPEGAVVSTWSEGVVTHQLLAPGMHMIAHHGVNDTANTARIAQWLPEFQRLTGLDDEWQAEWIATLSRTTELAADDERAILRDNRPYGAPTQSLMVCIAEVFAEHVRLDTAVLAEPAATNSDLTLSFERSI